MQICLSPRFSADTVEFREAQPIPLYLLTRPHHKAPQVGALKQRTYCLAVLEVWNQVLAGLCSLCNL